MGSTKILQNQKNTLHTYRAGNRGINRKLWTQSSSSASNTERDSGKSRRSMENKVDWHWHRKQNSENYTWKRKRPANIQNIAKTAINAPDATKERHLHIWKLSSWRLQNLLYQTKNQSGKQTWKPTHSANNIPHIPTLESNNGVPQNQRHTRP